MKMELIILKLIKIKYLPYIIITTIVIIICIIMLKNILNSNSYIQGKVIQLFSSNGSDSKGKNPVRYGNVKIKIISGNHKGEYITVQNIISETKNGESIVHLGNEVLLHIDENSDGTIKTAYILEVVRYNALIAVSVVFLILILLVGGIKGVKSILTLILSGLAVIKVLIPLILAGFDPVPITIFICIIVVIFNTMILCGKNKKSLSAIIGTSGGLLIAGILSYYITYSLNLKGLTDEELQMLIYITKNSNFNFSGLLLSGILLGALGAVMDVSISIVSSIFEVHRLNPEITMFELIKSGLNVGRDIMGSMSNTLILAYAGSSMYTLLLISSFGLPFSQMINQDAVASELIKALAGSIGLVLTIPLTAVAAGVLIKKNEIS